MSFNSEELRKSDIQYLIRHTSTSKFKKGEIVFLKSNPEQPIKVEFISEKQVYCSWMSVDGIKQNASFPPQCLLQYLYAGLIVYKGKPICLN